MVGMLKENLVDMIALQDVQRRDLLTQQKFGYLKGLIGDLRPGPTNLNGLTD